MKRFVLYCLAVCVSFFYSCENNNLESPNDPDTAEVVTIDRFSADAGTVYVRDEANELPEPGESINFDALFLKKGLGPGGEYAEYYDFDVQPLTTAPVFVVFREGEDEPVEDQLNILDVIPGETGYTDFWHMVKVIVPDNYVANTISSYEDIVSSGYETENTGYIINCPVVPPGSTADKRFTTAESSQLIRGWYKDKLVYYFIFEEKVLNVPIPEAGQPLMPISGILVTFNINPGEDGGGLASGFVMEPGSMQTHNVLETLPEDDDYSPLWTVSVYDNVDFDDVSDWTSASEANILGEGVMLVNCPVVEITE